MTARWRYLLLPAIVLCLFALITVAVESADTPETAIEHVLDVEAAPVITGATDVPVVAELVCPKCGRLHSQHRAAVLRPLTGALLAIVPDSDPITQIEAIREGHALRSEASGAAGVRLDLPATRADSEAAFASGRFTGGPA